MILIGPFVCVVCFVCSDSDVKRLSDALNDPSPARQRLAQQLKSTFSVPVKLQRMMASPAQAASSNAGAAGQTGSGASAAGFVDVDTIRDLEHGFSVLEKFKQISRHFDAQIKSHGGRRRFNRAAAGGGGGVDGAAAAGAGGDAGGDAGPDDGGGEENDGAAGGEDQKHRIARYVQFALTTTSIHTTR